MAEALGAFDVGVEDVAHLHGGAGTQLGLTVLGGEVGVEIGLEDGDLYFGYGGIPFGGKILECYKFGFGELFVCALPALFALSPLRGAPPKGEP